MAYQIEFKPGPDFEEVVGKYLDRLPTSSFSEPLTLVYPLWAESKVKWQWYNWMKCECPGKFQLSFARTESTVEISIQLREILSQVKGMVKAPEEADGFISGEIDKFFEKEGGPNEKD